MAHDWFTLSCDGTHLFHVASSIARLSLFQKLFNLARTSCVPKRGSCTVAIYRGKGEVEAVSEAEASTVAEIAREDATAGTSWPHFGEFYGTLE